MRMASLNISLPRAMKEFIASEVATGAYSTPSEYVRALIREARARPHHTSNDHQTGRAVPRPSRRGPAR